MPALLERIVAPHARHADLRPRRPTRRQAELLETLRELRQCFARREIDAAAYEGAVQRLGLEHLDF
jgi:hypothetical protein